jgi:3-deoxy-D-manno-octulosonic-acid transferase
MNILYSIIICFYYYIILFASIFNKKANLWINGRKNWASKLEKKITKDDVWIWFHCSSLGEFEDCCEVFFQIKKYYPSKKTILTVFSPSAFEALKNSNPFDIINYFPLDTKANAKTFIDIVNPILVIFSRSELWLNTLLEIKAKNVPAFLISLKLNNKSNFIRWPFVLLYKQCLKSFNTIFCQNQETQQLLYTRFDISNSLITGNTRFERVKNQSQINKKFPHVEKFVLNSLVVVIGSCLPKDERIFLDIYKALKPLNIKWIIVPHEFEKSIITKKINSNNFILYSKIENQTKLHNILIIDSVGILKYVYRYADFAIIGGGFDKIGIHNIIEPAVYGVQIAFGPNHKNYEEAIQLLNLGGASIFKNSMEIKELLQNKLFNTSNLILKEKIIQYVHTNTLNSSKITDSIRATINF